MMEGNDVSSWAARQANGGQEVPGTMDVADEAEVVDEEAPAGLQAQLEANVQNMKDLAEMIDQEVHHADRRLVTEDEVADAEDIVQALNENAGALAEMVTKIGERQAELDKEEEEDSEAENEEEDDDEE